MLSITLQFFRVSERYIFCTILEMLNKQFFVASFLKWHIRLIHFCQAPALNEVSNCLLPSHAKFRIYNWAQICSVALHLILAWWHFYCSCIPFDPSIPASFIGSQSRPLFDSMQASQSVSFRRNRYHAQRHTNKHPHAYYVLRYWKYCCDEFFISRGILCWKMDFASPKNIEMKFYNM